MKRLSLLSLILVIILLFSACQDHPVPATLPVLTLKGVSLFNRDLTFKIQFDEVGTYPIAEYGVVYKEGNSANPVGADPTLSDQVLVFPSAPGPGIKEATKTLAPNTGEVKVRTYVKLANGTIIYGEANIYAFIV